MGYDIRIHPQNPDIVFVTDNPSGFNKSYDGGKSWHQKNEGITVRSGSSQEAIPVFSATIDPGNPDNIWCGTQDSKGIFKSENCGETWIRKEHGVIEGSEISFRGFAIHPKNSDIVLAAAEIATPEQGVEFNKTKGKIYKTTDGGENWYAVWEGDNLARVLLFDYHHPDTIYCSTGIFDREAYNSDGDAQLPGGTGILRSYDGGENWTQVNNGIDNLYTGYLEMHPENPQILYAAAGNHTFHSASGKIYKTTDGGDTWKTILESSSLSAITVSKSNPDVVYAFNGAICFRSNNGGLNWTAHQKPGEGSWGPPGIKPGIPISAAVDPVNENRVFVNNYNGGNFLSTDGGKSWINSSNGYTGADIRDIQVDPDHPSVVYAVGRTGIFKTINGGEEWFGITNGVASPEFMSMSAVDQNFDTIYGVVDGQLSIIASWDGGQNWSTLFYHDLSINEQSGFHRFSDIQIAPSNPSIIYAGMSHILNIGVIDPDGQPAMGMYRSIDGGRNWTEINNGLGTGSKIINTITVHPDSSEVVFIGTYNDGIYKTINGGLSWISINNGLGSSDIRSIAIDPEHPEVLYAGSGNGFGIFKSVDGGDLWFDSNYGFQLKCPSYLSSFGKAVEGMDLDSRGPNFNLQDYNNVAWTKVLDIVIDPSNTSNIFAADHSSGIHYSSDGGASWARINSGISLRTVTCLTISQDGTVLYAGISGDGVLRLVLEEKVPVVQLTIPDCADTVTVFRGDSVNFEAICYDLNDDSLVYTWSFEGELVTQPSAYLYNLETAGLDTGYYALRVLVSDGDTTVSAHWVVKVIEVSTGNTIYPEGVEREEAIRMFPNPFSEYMDINYLLPGDAEVSIDVFDVIGKKIRNLAKEYQSAGVHSVQWNGRDQNRSIIPVGIYILRFVYKSDQELIIQERKVVYTH